MNSNELLKILIERFKEKGYSQVEDYYRFGCIRETPKSIIVSRQTGKDTVIPIAKIEETIKVVRKDHNVYNDGPSALKNHGITHINSPLWSLIHLLTLEEIIG